MENSQVPRSRPPRKKLKMPYIGDIFSGGSSSSGRPESVLTGKFTPLIVLVALLGFGWNYYKNRNKTDGAEGGENTIKEAIWEGKVSKKYTKVYSPENIHYIIEVKNPKGERRLYDLVGESTNFWDWVLPNYRISKKENSFEVTVKPIAKKDTVLVLQYSKK